jgi:cell division protein FtsW (lipid II flippase)
MLFEASLVVGAIAVLFPWFAVLATQEAGRDGRFANSAVVGPDLPEPVLPNLCANVAVDADVILRDTLCKHVTPTHQAERADRIPRALMDAKVNAKRVIALHHLINPERIAGLDCAFAQAEAAIASNQSATTRNATRANALLLLGAALDGHPSTTALALRQMQGNARPTPNGVCAGFDEVKALASASSLMAEVRAAAQSAMKNEAMRALLRTAGWQWAGWSLMGLLLLQLTRRPNVGAYGLALALAAWAAAAWVGRVPWPFGSAHTFVLARGTSSWHALPANFVLGMLAAAVVALLCARRLAPALISGPQRLASVFGYPGLVFATGVGWLLMLDLSANGHDTNRYLALYQQSHLWLGMLALTVIATIRVPLGRGLAWTLSLLDAVSGRVNRALGTAGGTALLVIAMLALIGVIAVSLINVRQLTSEMGKLWLIVGAAWFFFLRGTPLTERFGPSGNSIGSLARYTRPLLFVVGVLIGTMVVTRDMGPLLITGYAAGAFVSASVAMWWYQRRGTVFTAYLLAVLLFVTWIGATTGMLFRVGSLDEVAAARLENVATPLASANDQLALVTWFQRAAPSTGFGPGAVPWCGYGAAGTCAGVPAQIQSDYTFTALVGAFGTTAAWAMTLGCALWLHLIIGAHGHATNGEPRFIRLGRRIVHDDQAFLSWLCVMWVVLTLCQLAVTVAGNLAVIPLTGVTFPFVSFGMTSLVLNMGMLGLALNVNAPPRVPL